MHLNSNKIILLLVSCSCFALTFLLILTPTLPSSSHSTTTTSFSSSYSLAREAPSPRILLIDVASSSLRRGLRTKTHPKSTIDSRNNHHRTAAVQAPAPASFNRSSASSEHHRLAPSEKIPPDYESFGRHWPDEIGDFHPAKHRPVEDEDRALEAEINAGAQELKQDLASELLRERASVVKAIEQFGDAKVKGRSLLQILHEMSPDEPPGAEGSASLSSSASAPVAKGNKHTPSSPSSPLTLSPHQQKAVNAAKNLDKFVQKVAKKHDAGEFQMPAFKLNTLPFLRKSF